MVPNLYIPECPQASINMRVCVICVLGLIVYASEEDGDTRFPALSRYKNDYPIEVAVCKGSAVILALTHEALLGLFKLEGAKPKPLATISLANDSVVRGLFCSDEKMHKVVYMTR